MLKTAKEEVSRGRSSREVINIFKALSDPTRLRITLLLSQGELCVCDLMEILGMPQSTISRHMARLKSAGVVLDRRVGKWVHYNVVEEDHSNNTWRRLIQDLVTDEPYATDLRKYTKFVVRDRCK